MADIDNAIEMLEQLAQSPLYNLQVRIKLAQAYEAKGNKLLNHVAAMCNLDGAVRIFSEARAIYEMTFIPVRIQSLGLARIDKSLADICVAKGRCSEAKGLYERAEKELGAIDSDEKKRILRDIYVGLAGAISSLWENEDVTKEGEPPDSLIARCPASLEYFNKALALVGVSPNTDIQTILSALAGVSEDKRLFGYRVLLRMEMTRIVGHNELRNGAMANLELLKKAVAMSTPIFMSGITIKMFSREIDLNIGKLNLWEEEYDKARDIFWKVLQDKETILKIGEEGKSPTDSRKIEEKIKGRLDSFPDNVNLAAAVYLAESYQWNKNDQDITLAKSLLGPLYKNKGCPLYLRQEAFREFSAQYGDVGGVRISLLKNNKLAERIISLKFPLGGLVFGVGAGFGDIDHITGYTDKGKEMWDRKPFHHFDFELSKYFDEWKYLAFRASYYSMPQCLSIQEKTARAGFGQAFSLSKKTDLIPFVKAYYLLLTYDAFDEYFKAIGQSNYNPINKGFSAGVAIENKSSYKASISFDRDVRESNESAYGMPYTFSSATSNVTVAGEANVTDNLRVGGQTSIPLMRGGDMSLSSAGAHLRYDYKKSFSATLNVDHFVDEYKEGSGYLKHFSAGLNLEIPLPAIKKAISGGSEEEVPKTLPLNLPMPLRSSEPVVQNELPKAPATPPKQSLPQEDPPKPEAPKPAKISPPAGPEIKGEVQTAKSGDTVPKILSGMLGGRARMGRKEWDEFVRKFLKVNDADGDGLLDSYTAAQKRWVRKHQVAGDPLHWIFVGQNLKMPDMKLPQEKKDQLKGQNSYENYCVKSEKAVPQNQPKAKVSRSKAAKNGNIAFIPDISGRKKSV